MLRTEQKKGKKAKERGGIDVQNLADTSLFLAVFIGLWQLVFYLRIFPEVSLLPSPLMVGESFVELVQNMTLITSIGMTMYRLAIGFAVSIAIGLGVGLVMVKFAGFGKTMGSLL
jgi:NitT/TauT family transport system permease protein